MGTHIEEARKRKSGERIKELRKELNLTQEQLSDIIGRERSEISKWERGNGTISTETYWRLYDAFRSLEISMDYLMGVKDVRKPQNESIVNELHLSEQAIENIRYECSEKGNNQYIFMLNLILSNREVFGGLMDNLCALFYPPSLGIDLKNVPNFLLDKLNKDWLIIDLEYLSQVLVTPEEHYQLMKSEIEKLKKSAPETLIAPNEFNPITGYYEDEEEE